MGLYISIIKGISNGTTFLLKEDGGYEKMNKCTSKDMSCY